jgi:hypothetical protein
VAERPPGHAFAPGQLRPAQQTAEEAHIQGVEDFLKIVEMTLRTEVALVGAGAANQLRLPCDGGATGKALVTQLQRGIDLLLVVEFGQQNVRDGVGDRLWRALQQVREAHKELSLAEPNGGVQRGKAPKADRDGRHRRSGAQRPVFFLKDQNEIRGHLVQLTACGSSNAVVPGGRLPLALFRLYPLLASFVLVQFEVFGLFGRQVPDLFGEILAALDGLLAGQLECWFRW